MEYVFFDEVLQSRFVTLLEQRSVGWDAREDLMGGTIVSISDDLADEAMDEIEACYDTLLDEQSELALQREGWVDKRLAGVQVHLPDGRERTVALTPELANRLLAHFSAEEVAELVNAIAASLSQDFNGPICCYPEEK
jgi:hypothetical protein